jgi:hypothetical protein
MSWLITGTQKTDPDALAYLAEVERADGQALESGVRDAVIAFVTGCKADNVWNAIKASCILAGARTLTGALVPLVGAAPTNVGGLFVADDYNRKTGLVGNGSTKYLDSNQSGTAAPLDNVHIAVNLSSVHTQAGAPGAYLGNGGTGSGASNLFRANQPPLAAHAARLQSSSSGVVGSSSPPAGLFAAARSDSSVFNIRAAQTNFQLNIASQSPVSTNYLVFCRAGNSNLPEFFVNAGISFYSIGESLDLALLDARVTTLINAFDAAI